MNATLKLITNTFVPSKSAKKPRKKAKAPRQVIKSAPWIQRSIAVMLFAAGQVAMTVSLTHQADVIAKITGSVYWISMATAVVIELGIDLFVIGELVCCTHKALEKFEFVSKPAIYGSFLFSAVFNSMAFAAHSTNWFEYMIAGALGTGIPAFGFALYHGSVTLLLSVPKKRVVKAKKPAAKKA